MWQKAFVELIRSDYERRRTRNPKFSLRAYAKVLGLSPGAVFRIFRDEIQISSERAAEIMDRIKCDVADQLKIRTLMSPVMPALPTTPWPDKSNSLLTDWRYVAVLALLDCDLEFDTETIARKFGFSPDVAVSVFSELERQGHISIQSGVVLRAHSSLLKAGDVGSSEVIKHHHIQSLALAREAIDTPVENRDYVSVTFAGSKEQMTALREETRRYLDRMLVLAQTPTQKSDVFRLSVQLFPLTGH